MVARTLYLKSLRSAAPFVPVNCGAIADLAEPTLFDNPELGDWLRRFAGTYAAEASIFTMWSEAITRDSELGGVSAAVVDGSRARLARHLEPRERGGGACALSHHGPHHR